MQLRLFLKKLVSLFRKSSRLSQASDQARRECSDLFRSIITDETLAQALSSAVVNDNASLPYTESPADTLNELYSSIEKCTLPLSKNMVIGLIAHLIDHWNYNQPLGSLHLTGVEYVNIEPKPNGGYAEIHQGQYDGNTVALKYLNSYRNVQSDLPSSVATQEFIHEMLVWSHLKHGHIAELLGVVPIDSLIPNRRGLLMVSPWMGGNLREHLENLDRENHDDGKHNRYIEIANRLLYQVVQAIEYLHQNEIVHGDIRAVNVLIDDSDDRGNAILTDFGSATLVGIKNLRKAEQRKGGVRHQAPELLRSEVREPSFACDVYSFGILCFEVFTGQEPYPGATNPQIKFNVARGMRPEIPEDPRCPMPNEIKVLMESCWKDSPSKRPSVKKIVKEMGHICGAGQ